MASFSDISKIPKDTQFVVFENDSYQSPGYDKGDPSYTTNTISVSFFPDEPSMKAYVERCALYYPHKTPKVMKVSPVTVQTQVVFKYDGT
jgi:hypothetical protein